MITDPLHRLGGKLLCKTKPWGFAYRYTLMAYACGHRHDPPQRHTHTLTCDTGSPLLPCCLYESNIPACIHAAFHVCSRPSASASRRGASFKVVRDRGQVSSFPKKIQKVSIGHSRRTDEHIFNGGPQFAFVCRTTASSA